MRTFAIAMRPTCSTCAGEMTSSTAAMVRYVLCNVDWLGPFLFSLSAFEMFIFDVLCACMVVAVTRDVFFQRHIYPYRTF